MRIKLAGISTVLTIGILSPVVVQAVCDNYPLSNDQAEYLDNQELEIAIPDGDVAIVQRCDTNNDNVVDIRDIRAISLKRNLPASHPDDPMDWDKNSVIDILDARGCQRACTLPRCRISPPLEVQVDGVLDDAECFQVEDIDGDGKQDFVGIYEHSGQEERAGDWDLETVILLEDDKGQVQHMNYPYAGQTTSGANGDQKLHQHLSMQPAGTVDLNPGSVTIDRPGVVSYRYGAPKVLYYWKDGQMNRALFGIDD